MSSILSCNSVANLRRRPDESHMETAALRLRGCRACSIDCDGHTDDNSRDCWRAGAGEGGGTWTGDVLEGRGTHLSGEMPGVPPAELDRADVAHHLPGGAALGARHQGACGDASDAAVAHRPKRR